MHNLVFCKKKKKSVRSSKQEKKKAHSDKTSDDQFLSLTCFHGMHLRGYDQCFPCAAKLLFNYFEDTFKQQNIHITDYVGVFLYKSL